jgi:peptidoglycan/LPS O-acetylase OafA/YrhL
MTEVAGASTTPAPPEPPTRRLGYQPALDGVRGVAIALVVLFHYPWGVRHPGNLFGNNPVHGGFLGVDAFFVLSGFLITTLLLQEHARFGRVSLRHFYARRALRLLPALAVVLLIAVFLHFTLPTGDPNRPETGGLLGVLFYVANWVNTYRPKALGITADTWSLAIEEQFYLVWPIILVFLLRRRVRTGAIAVITALGAVASAAWCAWYWYDRLGGRAPNDFVAFVRGLGRFDVWNRVYFGSDTRASTLLVGSLTAIVVFALLPRLGPGVRAWFTVAVVGALVVCALIVSSARVALSGWLPEWGFLTFSVSTAVVVAGLVVVPRGVLARAFAITPLAWLCRRSYAVYLYHQLVFMYLRRSRVHLVPELSFVFQLVVILGVAELSHRLVEAPMLRRKRRFEPALSVDSAPTAAAESRTSNNPS